VKGLCDVNNRCMRQGGSAYVGCEYQNRALTQRLLMLLVKRMNGILHQGLKTGRALEGVMESLTPGQSDLIGFVTL